MGPLDIVFSDIDGTCVHYDMGHTFVAPGPLDEVGVQERLGVEKVQFPDGSSSWVLALPQSSSGSRGIISCKTLDMYQELRRLGKKVVLVSGCRASTLIQRLPFLPNADAYVCESGGRIFYPKGGDFCTLLEDLTWRNHHSSLPPKQHAAIKPEDYSGDLWEFYRYLISKEITVDSKNYSTAFRVKDSQITGKEVPSSLAYSTNLGSLDVYPPTSGKLNAAKYLMKRFDGCPEASVFLCDDDNDIELALHVSKAFLPGITSDSMRATVENNAEKFRVSEMSGIYATEQMLQEILASCIDS